MFIQAKDGLFDEHGGIGPANLGSSRLDAARTGCASTPCMPEWRRLVRRKEWGNKQLYMALCCMDMYNGRFSGAIPAARPFMPLYNRGATCVAHQSPSDRAGGVCQRGDLPAEQLPCHVSGAAPAADRYHPEANHAYAQKLASSTENFRRRLRQQLAYSARLLPRHFADPAASRRKAAPARQTNSFNSVLVVNAQGTVLAVSPETLALQNRLASEGARQALRERGP
jgi:hypothetical protein